MHAAYVQERTGASVVTDPGKGFATWLPLFDVRDAADVRPREVYIVDIYVAPEHRRNGVAAGLADRVAAAARDIGATRLVGSVDARTKTRTDALRALLAYGFALDRVDGEMLWLSKEIG